MLHISSCITHYFSLNQKMPSSKDLTQKHPATPNVWPYRKDTCCKRTLFVINMFCKDSITSDCISIPLGAIMLLFIDTECILIMLWLFSWLLLLVVWAEACCCTTLCAEVLSWFLLPECFIISEGTLNLSWRHLLYFVPFFCMRYTSLKQRNCRVLLFTWNRGKMEVKTKHDLLKGLPAWLILPWLTLSEA